MPDERLANPFALSVVGVLYDAGRPYHHPRTLARAFAVAGVDTVGRALDVACGTGLSAVALAERAHEVIGCELSSAMLSARRAHDRVHYVQGAAERLPLDAASFDLVTVSSGVHWFDQERFFAEVDRVLRPDGWVGLYDHYFIGTMEGVPEFATWMSEQFTRYPLPPRTHQVGDPRAVVPSAFEKIGEEFVDDPIEMTQDEFVDYSITISNLVAAVERGESREEIRRWIIETTAAMFDGSTRTVGFLGSVIVLRR